MGDFDNSLSDKLILFFDINQRLANFVNKDSLYEINNLFFLEHGFSAESIDYYNHLGLKQLEYIKDDKILFRDCCNCHKIQLFGLWGDWRVKDNVYKTSGFCSPKCMQESMKLPLSECEEIFNEALKEPHFLLDVN